MPRQSTSILLSVVGISGSAALAQPSFQVIRPDTGYDYAVIQDVSPDGNRVLVSLQQSTVRPDPLKGYVLVLETGARTEIADPFGNDLNPLAMSADGSVVVGYIGGGPLGSTEAVLWGSDGLIRLGGLPAGNLSYATGVSADGSTVVGTTGANSGDPYQQAWRWSEATDFVPLNDLGTDILTFGSAEDISGDGSTIVGFGSVGDFDGDTDDYASAAYWAGSSLNPTDLGNLPNPQPALGGSMAVATSANGSVIVGTSPAIAPNGSFANHGWRWTSATGVVDLGVLPTRPNASITISDISADGNTIVGYTADGGVNQWEAVVWTQATGFRFLRTILADQGITIPATLRLRETYCSGDGSVIAGWAYDTAAGGVYVGYVARLGSSCPCPADFNGSGGTPDVSDIDAFFTGWLAGAANADADCSGGTPDVTDIGVFFSAWLAGGC
jgi:uncharacterized membrane protein